MRRSWRVLIERALGRRVQRIRSQPLADLLLLELRTHHDGFALGFQRLLARRGVEVSLSEIESQLRELERRNLVVIKVYCEITNSGYRAAADLARELGMKDPALEGSLGRALEDLCPEDEWDEMNRPARSQPSKTAPNTLEDSE